MNAKELLERFDFAGFNPQAQETILRALRLLAAAEGGEDRTPETDALELDVANFANHLQANAFIKLSRSLENQRDALAARVRELERKIEIAADRLTGHGGVLSALNAARSK